MLTSIAEYEKHVITPFLKFILTLCMSTSVAKFGKECSRLILESMSTSIAGYRFIHILKFMLALCYKVCLLPLQNLVKSLVDSYESLC